MSPAALKRSKTSHAVVEHVYQEILEGRLRPGDRVDVDATSEALDVSPTPVREALALLERDGVVASRLHRAALIERFDAHTLRADFHVLGLLSGVAAARVARYRDPAVVAELQRLLDELQATPADDIGRRQQTTDRLIEVQHAAGATPRLLAQLRGFGGFLEAATRTRDGRRHEDVVAAHAAVVGAIVDGDERRASAGRLADARAIGDEVIADLVRRGVLTDDGAAVAG